MHEERKAAINTTPAPGSPEAMIQKEERQKYHQIEAVAVAGGAATGALAGAVAGPPGAIAGAVVGGVVSAITCLVLDREERRQEIDQVEMDRQATIDEDALVEQNREREQHNAAIEAQKTLL